jgi:hypothetical protein
MKMKAFSTGLLIVASALVACGDEPQQPSEKQRAEHLARMKEVVESIRVLGNPRVKDATVKLLDKPVLRYADETRQTLESAMWIWSGGGRPTAVLAIEFHPDHPAGPQWLFEIASLSTRAIAVERGEELQWTGKGPGLAFRRLESAEPVADKATKRLSQMKELCRRFTAHEQASKEGRIELRLLTSPLHRYSATDQDVVDGAIFGFCSGTNPEVLLVLEAQRPRDAAAAWHYALVQWSGEPVTAHLDEEQVFERGEVYPPAVRDNYVNGWFAADKEAKGSEK